MADVLKTATNSDIEALKKRQKIKNIVIKTITYIFLVVMAILIVFPFYWMINSSLKTYDEYHLLFNPKVFEETGLDFTKFDLPTFFPKLLDLDNYYEALFGGQYEKAKAAIAAGENPYQYMQLVKAMVTTLIMGVASTLLSIFVTIFAAFAFGRLKFKGRELLFTVLLMTMMIPGELFTITNYETVSFLNWTYRSAGNTWKIYLSYTLPFLVSVFYIYLLRNNFKQIPDELYYAAKVDGSSDFKYLFKVMVPLSMPSIISIVILKMMGAWNSYVWPNLVGSTDNGTYMLVSVILRKNYTAMTDGGYADIPVRMAACVIVSIPLFLVFILFRKYIIRGVSKSGIKG